MIPTIAKETSKDDYKSITVCVMKIGARDKSLGISSFKIWAGKRRTFSSKSRKQAAAPPVFLFLNVYPEERMV